MKIGDIEIYRFYLGNMRVCGGPVFGIIPKKIWNQHVKCDQYNRITAAIYTLLIVKDGYVAVLDTGFGDKMDDKTLKAYGVEKNRSVSEAIKEHGYYTGDITHCILSHLHVDHCGGCTKLVDTKIVPSFPNAKYYVQQREYDDGVSPTRRTRATYFPQNFEPLYEQGRLLLQNGIERVTPFITVHPTKGHVNAMNIIEIITGERNIYYPGDLIGQKELVHPLWNSAYDYYPLKSEENKVKLLEKCIEEDAWLFLPHDPSGNFFRVAKEKEYCYNLIAVNNI